MVMSTFQKVTLATCVVLCVALLLPKMLLSRGRKDAAELPEGSGRFPPKVRHMAPESRGQRAAGSAGLSRAHNPEAISRAKGVGQGTGAGTAGKSNLAGQIIPVYGFGILLYILYILFKITSKGNSRPAEGRFASVRSENMKRKITDFELAQLQEKLRETELVMEKIVSKAHHSPDRVKGVMADQEESLLQQLTEITRVMQEGQLVEGATPERAGNQKEWEGYPDEHHQSQQRCCCCCQHDQQRCSPPSRGERQEADGAELLENIPVTGEAEEVELEMTTGSEGALGTENDVDVKEENSDEGRTGGGLMDLGLPEEDLRGVLEELELTLKMTELSQPVQKESAVRRRNKRRRAKKDVQSTDVRS